MKYKDYFYVSRKNWLRGKGCKNSYLLHPTNGSMCCLGFFCNQLGVPKEDLKRLKEPQQLLEKKGWEDIPYLMNIHSENQKQLTITAMVINDDDFIEDDIREEKLIELFASEGIELEFKP